MRGMIFFLDFDGVLHPETTAQEDRLFCCLPYLLESCAQGRRSKWFFRHTGGVCFPFLHWSNWRQGTVVPMSLISLLG